MKSILFAIPTLKEDTPERMSFAKRLAGGIEALGIRVHKVGVVKSPNPIAFIRQGLVLRTKIRELKPDVIVAQYGSYTGLLVAVFGTPPIIVTLRGSDLNPEPYTNRALQLMQHSASRLAALLADGIVCVSRELADRLTVRKPSAIIPSPTDLDLFRPRNQQECRGLLGWPSNEHVAVFLGGKNAKLKGIDLAHDVRRELLSRRSQVNLRIVDSEIPIAEVHVYLNAADCLLFLSRYEGSPNLIREACACNLPVVATPAGDISEVLREVAPGRLVARDVREIADAVESICGSGTRSNGRDHVNQYSTAEISRRSVDFYQEVAGRCAASKAPTLRT